MCVSRLEHVAALALLAPLALALGGCPTGKTGARGDAANRWLDAGDVRVAGDSAGDNVASDADGAAALDTATPDGGGDINVDIPAPVPDSGATSIVLVALDAAFTGNLGGVAGADALCRKAAAAATWPGTYRAFISSSAQDARDIVPAGKRNLPVLDSRGVTLFGSWNAIFSTNEWSKPAWVYTFSGKLVDESGPWWDADTWNGTRKGWPRRCRPHLPRLDDVGVQRRRRRRRARPAQAARPGPRRLRSHARPGLHPHAVIYVCIRLPISDVLPHCAQQRV